MKQERFLFPLLFITIACVLLASPALGGLVSQDFVLEGAQEVPPVESANSGTCTGSLNSSATAYRLQCQHDVADATAAHIHMAAPGVGGPIVFFLNATTSFDFTVNDATLAQDAMDNPVVGLDFAAFLAALNAGNLYVNVHTPANMGGEIRGQIPVPPDVAYLAQFGNGDSSVAAAGAVGQTIVSDIVLINTATTGDPVVATVQFFDSDGNVLSPDDLFPGGLVAGVRASGSDDFVEVELDPLGDVTLRTNGTGPQVSGSAIVTGPVASFIRFDISGIGVAGVRPSNVTDYAIAPMRREGTLSTGLAIRNTEDFDLIVDLTLLADGVPVENGTANLVLAPDARDSRFLEQYFPAVFEGLEGAGTTPTDFVGTVLIQANGAFAAIAIELDVQNGIITTLPTVEVDDSGEESGDEDPLD